MTSQHCRRQVAIAAIVLAVVDLVAGCGPAHTPCHTDPIYFDFDSAEIGDPMREAMEHNAECILQQKQVVRLEGHHDDQGTPEYKLALAHRLGARVRDVLVRLGVPAETIHVISYGNTRPVCTDPTEACRARCRRVDIRLEPSL